MTKHVRQSHTVLTFDLERLKSMVLEAQGLGFSLNEDVGGIDGRCPLFARRGARAGVDATTAPRARARCGINVGEKLNTGGHGTRVSARATPGDPAVFISRLR